MSRRQAVGEQIGLLGGTFNPIHNGHLKAADLVCGLLKLNRVLFIPSYIPPHKESFDILPPHHRMRMVKLALDSYPKFYPSDVEIKARQKSYSIHTLTLLKKRHPTAEIFFILGIDAFLEIGTWKDYRKVLDQCSFAVISRPGYSLQDARTALDKDYRERLIEASGDKSLLRGKGDPVILLLEMKTLDISSTEIRRRIRAGLSIDGLVPDPVAMYIYKNELYQEKV